MAPEIFRRLGADVEAIATSPDGRNINDGCGSTHLDGLIELVRSGGFEAGFGFDGDGDRVLAVDRTGSVVDGDELIALAALHLRAAGRLPGDGVAVTVMTNYGFHSAMSAAGIEVATTPVGDRSVLAELVKRGWALGGEQSGHIIDTGFVPSGDGIAAALLTLEALGDGDLADRGGMEKLPQTLVNVTVADREAVNSADAVWKAVEEEGEQPRGPRPRAHPPERHRARGARDGRGPRRGRGSRGDRPASRPRRTRARLAVAGALEGRVALVAGATRGAGRGIATELGAAGATVGLQRANDARAALGVRPAGDHRGDGRARDEGGGQGSRWRRTTSSPSRSRPSSPGSNSSRAAWTCS